MQRKGGVVKTREGEGRRRIQVDFSPEAHDRLLRIREQSGAQSSAEVFRDALRLYAWFLEQKDAGRRLQVVSGDEAPKEVELLF